MTQEIDTTQSKELVTHDEEIENIQAAAQADAGFEKILKFKKGEYAIGEDAIPLGTEYLAHAVGWTKSWIKFKNGEVAERKLYRVARAEKPPERQELDELDKVDLVIDGMSADPWVYQYLLPLEDMTSGEIVVFVTATHGGRRAVADLCQAYTRHAKKGHGGQPIIKIGCTDMPTKKFGKVPRPEFEIIGWDGTGDDNVPSPTLQKELNDAIPF